MFSVSITIFGVYTLLLDLKREKKTHTIDISEFHKRRVQNVFRKDRNKKLPLL